METRIREQWTESTKVKYIPEVQSGWWIFKSWSTLNDYRIWKDLEMIPPFGIHIDLICDTFSEAENILTEYKRQQQPVKQNIIPVF